MPPLHNKTNLCFLYSNINSLNASLLKPTSSFVFPDFIFAVQFGSESKGLPTATKSKSPLSKRLFNSSNEVGSELSPANAPKKSFESPIEPTVMVGAPVTFLAHPAKFRSDFSNSGSQNRRCEQCRMSTPASTRGVSQASNSCGVFASYNCNQKV